MAPNFSEPATYERRLVVFYDVLGWRSKVESFGDLKNNVTMLKNIASAFEFSKSMDGVDEYDIRTSTFSDNVVISSLCTPKAIAWVLLKVALIQFGVAGLGFLIRGGVTIGEIVHDSHVVFGPALNRAYDLERKEAKNPRILLDAEHINELIDGTLDFVVHEEGECFLDPFTIEFARGWCHYSLEKGEEVAAHDKVCTVACALMVESVLLKHDEVAEAKIMWLLNRINARISEEDIAEVRRRFRSFTKLADAVVAQNVE